MVGEAFLGSCDPQPVHAARTVQPNKHALVTDPAAVANILRQRSQTKAKQRPP